MIKWTEEKIDFLRQNAPRTPLKDLCIRFNNRFQTDATLDSISNALRKNKIYIGVNTGRFKKGQPALNKGKTWDEYMPKESQERCRKTCFQKGKNINNNHYHYRTIGDEKIVDGYVEVRIETINENREKGGRYWKPKHHIVYEEHYGPIPKGYVCIFLDGNKRNFDISNLAIITKNQNKILNKNHLRSENPTITKAAVTISKLEEKANERRKQHGN